jgi:hypothetical protein
MQDSDALDLFERAVSLHPAAAVQLAREQVSIRQHTLQSPDV